MAGKLKNDNPGHDLTTEEARKGGLNSVKARREKKFFREEIEKQLGASIKDIVKANILQAKKGNVQASIFLRDTIGEKPVDKVENTISYEDSLKDVIDEEEY